MSLATIYQPTGILPVNNPVPVIVSSSFSDQAGFRYKIELLNASDVKQLEVWVYPDTENTNYGIYDFSMPLSDLIGSDLNNWNTTGVTTASSSYYRFKWKVTEYIGSTSGDTLTSGILHAFRGVVQYETKWNRNNYLPGRYTLTTPWDGSLASFLSNKNKRKYKLTEYGVVNTLCGSFSSDISIWTRVLYQVMINTDFGPMAINYYAPIVSPNTNFYEGSVYTIPIGPKQLNQMAVSGKLYYDVTDIPTSAEILTDSEDYYYVYIQSGLTTFTEKLRIDLDKNCYKHEGVEFLYLGDFGTYETYTFRMGNVKSFDTNRNEVKSNYYGVVNNEYNYNFGSRGRKNINIRTTESHTIYSDWIRDEEAEDLMELFRSPDVYIIKNDSIFPIIITDTSYELKTILNNRLFNYKINYEMAFEKLSNI